MAVYFHNTLMPSGDYLRTTREFSSLQSLSRARKKGRAPVIVIGRFRFAHSTPEATAAFYGLPSWDGLPLITGNQVPAGLATLNKVSKLAKVGESQMLSWALFNRIDIYWIGGTFFARAGDARQIALAENARKAQFTKPKQKRIPKWRVFKG